MNQVVIVDYSMGNVDSVRRALEECGGNVSITKNPAEIAVATHIILPGVGAFAAGMNNLHTNGLVELLTKQAVRIGVPFLGICLGMQLLADIGFENGKTPGLGFIPGEVRLLELKEPSEHLPHVGWNEVQYKKKSSLCNAVASGKDFYFVHSYHFVCKDPENIVATTPYAGEFASIVQKNNIYGVQFHPEKSQKVGLQLLRNFLALNYA